MKNQNISRNQHKQDTQRSLGQNKSVSLPDINKNEKTNQKKQTKINITKQHQVHKSILSPKIKPDQQSSMEPKPFSNIPSSRTFGIDQAHSYIGNDNSVDNQKMDTLDALSGNRNYIQAPNTQMNQTVYTEDQKKFNFNVQDHNLRATTNTLMPRDRNQLHNEFMKRGENENLRYAVRLNHQKRRNMQTLESRLNLLQQNEKKMLIKIDLERKKVMQSIEVKQDKKQRQKTLSVVAKSQKMQINEQREVLRLRKEQERINITLNQKSIALAKKINSVEIKQQSIALEKERKQIIKGIEREKRQKTEAVKQSEGVAKLSKDQQQMLYTLSRKQDQISKIVTELKQNKKLDKGIKKYEKEEEKFIERIKNTQDYLSQVSQIGNKKQALNLLKKHQDESGYSNLSHSARRSGKPPLFINKVFGKKNSRVDKMSGSYNKEMHQRNRSVTPRSKLDMSNVKSSNKKRSKMVNSFTIQTDPKADDEVVIEDEPQFETIDVEPSMPPVKIKNRRRKRKIIRQSKHSSQVKSQNKQDNNNHASVTMIEQEPMQTVEINQQ